MVLISTLSPVGHGWMSTDCVHVWQWEVRGPGGQLELGGGGGGGGGGVDLILGVGGGGLEGGGQGGRWGSGEDQGVIDCRGQPSDNHHCLEGYQSTRCSQS